MSTPTRAQLQDPVYLAQEIAKLQAKIDAQTPEWTTPTREEINLAAVEPEDLGLDSFNTADSLVKAIYRAQERDGNIPAELKAKPNWVRWQLENVNECLTKVPYQLNGNKASSTDPTTWTTYENIATGTVVNEKQGIGIMTDSSFIGFDLDGCRNPATGEITEWAQRVIKTLGTYTEITPSGYGVRAYAFGNLPDGARRFSVATSAGFGDKVGIEVYNHARYFTVTGNRIGENYRVDSGNIQQAYELCQSISRELPSEKRKAALSDTSGNGGSVQIERGSSMFISSKLALLMYGQIASRSPFVVQDEHGNKLTYPSQSEADMALATVLAIKHGDNPELIDADFRESALYRSKWDRLADHTIKKAIETAKKFAAPIASVASIPSTETTSDENQIPEFDESVITGIYRDIVSVAVRGTTIPPQFAFLNAKVYFGARMASGMSFEGLDCDSSYYGAVIGTTGTSKGESWRRTTEKILLSPQFTNLKPTVKVIHGADSGAGLRDAFFDQPDQLPIVCYVDEATSLGHKAGEKKNPEIIDTMVELADSHRFSRVKAKRGKDKASKTHDNARLSMYMCGQDGEAFMSAFSGRTKMGLYDRLYPEFSEPIEAGDLPEIDQSAIVGLHPKKL